jgi:hypothetical protein
MNLRKDHLAKVVLQLVDMTPQAAAELRRCKVQMRQVHVIYDMGALIVPALQPLLTALVLTLWVSHKGTSPNMVSH